MASNEGERWPLTRERGREVASNEGERWPLTRERGGL